MGRDGGPICEDNPVSDFAGIAAPDHGVYSFRPACMSVVAAMWHAHTEARCLNTSKVKKS